MGLNNSLDDVSTGSSSEVSENLAVVGESLLGDSVVDSHGGTSDVGSMSVDVTVILTTVKERLSNL